MDLILSAAVILLKVSLITVLLAIPAISSVRYATKLRLDQFKKGIKTVDNAKPRVIGFFHPFCDAMGGGEKVLFQALKAIQAEQNFDNDTILIYSGAKMEPENLCQAVKEKFGTTIDLRRN